MKVLEKTYSRSGRIVSKAKFTYWVFLTEVLVAIILGGIMFALWEYADKIEGYFTDGKPVEILTDQNLKWALLGCGAYVVIATLIHALIRYRKELILTEDKLVHREGVLVIKSEIIALAEIKAVDTKQNALQRIMGYGNICVISDAEKPLVVRHIIAPEKFARRVMNQVTQERSKEAGKALQLKLMPVKSKNKKGGR